VNESIKQGLTAFVAGILFCIAVTVLLTEIDMIRTFEKVSRVNSETVWEKGTDSICRE